MEHLFTYFKKCAFCVKGFEHTMICPKFEEEGEFDEEEEEA